MTTLEPSDAFVLFGATGDLASKKIAGDATLFGRQDAVEAAWTVVDPVLGDAVPVHPYEPGTWGPPAADRVTDDVGGWAQPGMSP